MDFYDPRNLEMYDVYASVADFLDNAANSGTLISVIKEGETP